MWQYACSAGATSHFQAVCTIFMLPCILFIFFCHGVASAYPCLLTKWRPSVQPGDHILTGQLTILPPSILRDTVCVGMGVECLSWELYLVPFCVYGVVTSIVVGRVTRDGFRSGLLLCCCACTAALSGGNVGLVRCVIPLSSDWQLAAAWWVAVLSFLHYAVCVVPLGICCVCIGVTDWRC